MQNYNRRMKLLSPVVRNPSKALRPFHQTPQQSVSGSDGDPGPHAALGESGQRGCRGDYQGHPPSYRYPWLQRGRTMGKRLLPWAQCSARDASRLMGQQGRLHSPLSVFNPGDPPLAFHLKDNGHNHPSNQL